MPFIFMIILLATHNLLHGMETTSCGPPHTIKSTVPISDSHPVGTKIRYMCVKGYKRRAGTSSLIVCKINKMTNLPTWETSLPLECIYFPDKNAAPATTAPGTINQTTATTLCSHCTESRTPFIYQEKSTDVVIQDADTSSESKKTTYTLRPHASPTTAVRPDISTGSDPNTPTIPTGTSANTITTRSANAKNISLPSQQPIIGGGVTVIVLLALGFGIIVGLKCRQKRQRWVHRVSTEIPMEDLPDTNLIKRHRQGKHSAVLVKLKALLLLSPVAFFWRRFILCRFIKPVCSGLGPLIGVDEEQPMPG
ncbi:interleukin-15 receptor subunit alpha isoform X2 [Denticeps clupeoides]|uniref:interleukin-15 receptor subunit alpha isoform X2 n=1 Tax=Denticeps clupeoides TaxID=299321 RepID=UPI0010A33D70|nr:interleukin-15 receptor subunit alpha isoform X2 [Denticeps clupeoides]